MVARTQRPKAKLTRPMQKEDWFCPCHDCMVEERVRMVEKDNGTMGYGGTYYACPQYSECGYYVNHDQKVVPVTDGNGIALGKLLPKKRGKGTWRR